VKTVIVDAYDSFVHIIDSYFQILGAGPVVIRAGEASVDRIAQERPDLLVLGPGPGHPANSGHVELVHAFAQHVPIFGVCLGHQAIGLAYGAKISQASHLMHGKSCRIDHDGRGAFADSAPLFHGTRYHSLIVEESSIPADLVVSARASDDGYVMGMRHRTLPIESVQFHPESITTEAGMNIFRSFMTRHGLGPSVSHAPAIATVS
jgi:anthranilate synthase/aminodeoxychorismate synthase-like glutamine amidotransferase